MDVRELLKKYAIEYISEQRELSECAIPKIRWSSLRRVLVANKKYFDASDKDKMLKSSCLLEKKRAESRFWLETGIRWPSIVNEV